VLSEGVKFIYNWYLEFPSKKETTPAATNILMLNYDHYLDINDNAKLESLTPELAKTRVNLPCYSEIPENLRLLLVDLLFV
jgi:hypothetical protein